ncbi:unnamed protein product [Mucor hiemalis]
MENNLTVKEIGVWLTNGTGGRGAEVPAGDVYQTILAESCHGLLVFPLDGLRTSVLYLHCFILKRFSHSRLQLQALLSFFVQVNENVTKELYQGTRYYHFEYSF